MITIRASLEAQLESSFQCTYDGKFYHISPSEKSAKISGISVLDETMSALLIGISDDFDRIMFMRESVQHNNSVEFLPIPVLHICASYTRTLYVKNMK